MKILNNNKQSLPFTILKNGKKIYLNDIEKRISGEFSFRKFNHGYDITSRTSIINHLISTYDYKNYLEIGVRDLRNFDAIKCYKKIGIDPKPLKLNKQIYKKTSDDFFSQLDKKIKFDIIFIDGLHLELQVDKDIDNSLKHLKNNGRIIIHDCNPPSEFHQRDNYEINGKFPAWNGTTWRSFIKNRMTNKNINMCVVDCDWGVGIIKKGKQNLLKFKENFSYRDLQQNRICALNLISVDDFLIKYIK